MRLKLVSLLAAAIFALSACSSTPEPTNTGSTGSTGSTVSYGTLQEQLRAEVGDRVFFDTDRSDLSGEARETVARQAEWLRRYPNTRIVIEGHADERGTREYNLALAERRAVAVRNYMVALGIPAARVSTTSYGKERPAVVGSNEAAYAQNRRAVTVVN